MPSSTCKIVRLAFGKEHMLALSEEGVAFSSGDAGYG